MKQSLETWKNIFRNLEEEGEQLEVIWLESSDEWCLCTGTELFEDGFKTEDEANNRLEYLEKTLL
ncbi:hypothetical protein BSP36_003 [Bacillus phage BSP36]|uniref:Uncharacterized protein n=1 Tax=Bacillus phage BSP38 TaxID=2283013 RepID=A0A345MJL5_BPBSP|nr:hypothetical protein HWB82_gp005 [Bacillus phage BSP38]AXH71047.1 hypothetical protein BSP38_005 [Bacillus phage BSP38]AYJ75090.1 hypothetical protein BSP36_003 [Bacillus phage BSP36]